MSRSRSAGDAGVDPWDREYARRGRLWGGSRLDAHTTCVLDEDASLAMGRWLDAGCGDGKGLVPLLSRLDEAAPAVVALDASRAALLHAVRGVQETHGPGGLARVRFVLADALRPPLSEGVFDAVRAVHLVGHLRGTDRVSALRSMLGLLRRGGVLVLSEFGLEDFRAGKGVEVEPGTWRRGTGIETHYFSRDELAEAVERAGGRVRQLDSERFRVHYGGEALPRQRWDLVALRPS